MLPHVNALLSSVCENFETEDRTYYLINSANNHRFGSIGSIDLEFPDGQLISSNEKKANKI